MVTVHAAIEQGRTEEATNQRGPKRMEGAFRDWAEVANFGPKVEVLNLDAATDPFLSGVTSAVATPGADPYGVPIAPPRKCVAFCSASADVSDLAVDPSSSAADRRRPSGSDRACAIDVHCRLAGDRCGRAPGRRVSDAGAGRVAERSVGRVGPARRAARSARVDRH